MKLQLVGCSHHHTPLELRERLAFRRDQIAPALLELRQRFPHTEAVLLSTCNRVELYTAAENPRHGPSHQEAVEFLAEFHGLSAFDVFDELFEHTGEDAVRHLFNVAASLDSMVMGEAQILAQVKEAYQLATDGNSTGPLTHAAFQRAIRVAKRVAHETAINQKRVSIPSVAVADFASQIFERLDDKRVLVIGAGEMAEETVRYLIAEGARDITVVNRNRQHAEQLAARFHGRAEPWQKLNDRLTTADLVISTTGAEQPVVTLKDYQLIEERRYQRTLFVLDLAVPRDFEPSIGDCLGVYLYSIDDLRQACEVNRRQREKEWPKAERIIEEETARFMAELHHRATGPTIKRLKARAQQMKDEELARLLNKLADVDQHSRAEIEQSFDRLVNKLLHPPLESLRDEARKGAPHGLLDALRRLFQLKE